MDNWSNCGKCNFSRESLLELPCCSALFCKNCLISTSRCPKCGSFFDIKDCIVYIALQATLSELFVNCKYEGCNYLCHKLLYDFHLTNCVHRPESPIDLLDPSYIPRDELKLRKKNNIVQSYSKLFGSQDPQVHVILPSDTLVGIALRYNVTVGSIKRLNGFYHNNIHCYDTLKIPSNFQLLVPPSANKLTEDELAELFRKRLVSKLKFVTKLQSENEAQFYLEDCLYDYDAALKLVTEDIDWEKHNPIPINHSIQNNTKSIPIDSKKPNQNKTIINSSSSVTPTCFCLPL
eukprot:TRINITY_DN156_c1_g1_i1.p1 TRINITY_DN156_c1_g1~~TRINITY_DN156_c1_g1_i1.p1  ORF type:complete len:291 (-),score=96.04 TRINITY_DN156_c1_g1_i1:303-1175(-)